MMKEFIKCYPQFSKVSSQMNVNKLKTKSGYLKLQRKAFTSFDHKTDYKDDGTLSDKYYKENVALRNLSDTIFEEFLSEIKEEQKQVELFQSEEKKKEFLESLKHKFVIPRKIYQSALEKGMVGDAIRYKHKNVDLFVIGTMYDRINSLNLYKLLNLLKPDLILIQMRPDKLLSNIDKFYQSEKLLEKLTRNADEIQPSLEVRNKTLRKLRDNGFILDSNKFNEEGQSSFKSIMSGQCERMNAEALSAISIWGEQKDTKIVLADIPEDILFEKLSNSLTLMQVRQIFEDVFTQFPNNPDWEPRTPLGTAINLYPDLFVAPSDSFISQTVERISKELPREIKVVSFVGYGQTNTLPIHLEHDTNKISLEKALTVPPRFSSLISGEDTLEVLVEKWCLLFLIFRGIEDANNTPLKNNILINKLISKYARDDMIKTGFNSENHLVNRMSHLFGSLLEDKTEEAIKFIGQGFDNKKKIFMRKIFNDPMLNSQLL